MEGLDGVLDRLEQLLGTLEELDEPAREYVFELLGVLDVLHRQALERLAERLGEQTIEELRAGDPLLAWLFDAYTEEESPRPEPEPHRASGDGVLQIRRRSRWEGPSAGDR